jgi:DNA-binding transcriptional ArsR family regulator
LRAATPDRARLAIVERLARGPTSASALVTPTTISLPAVLKHVRVLEEGGLVATVKRGRVRECRLRDDALVAVATWTPQQQALWSTRLDALGTLLEGYRLRFGPRPDGDAYSETATYAVFEPVERLVLDVLTAGEDMSESSRCTVLLMHLGSAA